MLTVNLERYPYLQIDTRQQPAQRLLADLLDSDLDVVIFSDVGPLDSLKKTELLTEQLAVVCLPSMLPLMSRQPVLKALQAQLLTLLNRQFLMRQDIDCQAQLERRGLRSAAPDDRPESG